MFTLGCVAAGLYLLLLGFKILLSLHYIQKMSRALNLDSINNNPVGCVKRTSTNVAKGDLSDITIMQPILSGDPLLESTLRYNLEHTSKDVSFIWLVDEEDTEGINLTQSIAQAFSNIHIIQCPSVPQNLNPKLFKLNLGVEQVKTTYIAILDDDTQLSKESLSMAQKHLSSADIYTGFPYYLPANTLWSSLVAHFVNNNSALTYLPILYFTPAFSLNGMFYMLKLETLNTLGGFSAIQHQLTDDYAMAKRIRQHQGSIIQGVTTQGVQTSIPTLGDYIRIMHRWYVFALLQINDQKRQIKTVLFIFLLLPTLLFWVSLFTLLSSLKGLLVIILFLVMQFILIRYLQKRIIPTSPRSSFCISFFSQCLQVLHILHALLVKRIRWRKRQILVMSDGSFCYLKE